MAKGTVGDLAIRLSVNPQGMDAGLRTAVGKLDGLRLTVSRMGGAGGGSGGLPGLLAGGGAGGLAGGGVGAVVGATVGAITDGIGMMVSAIKTAVSALTELTVAAGSFAAKVVGYSLKVGVEFEREMSRVAAISGATGRDFDLLQEKARELGRTTEFTAAQAAQAMSELAMGGFNTQQILAGVTPALDLARVSGMELAEAADLIAVSVGGFRMEAGEATRIVDVLSKAAINTSSNVRDFGEAFKYVVPAAAATGRSVEEVSAALAIMAKSGIRGAMAGTALRGIMMKMARPTAEAAEALKDVGVEFFDGQGRAKKFTQILVEVGAAIEHMNEQQQLEFFGTQFEKRAATGFIALKNLGPQALADFERMLTEEAAGTGQRIGGIMIDNVWGSFKIFESAVQGAAEGFFSTFRGPLKEATLSLATLIADSFARLKPDIAASMADLAAHATEQWEALAAKFGDSFNFDHLRQAWEGVAMLARTVVDDVFSLIHTVLDLFGLVKRDSPTTAIVDVAEGVKAAGKEIEVTVHKWTDPFRDLIPIAVEAGTIVVAALKGIAEVMAHALAFNLDAIGMDADEWLAALVKVEFSVRHLQMEFVTAIQEIELHWLAFWNDLAHSTGNFIEQMIYGAKRLWAAFLAGVKVLGGAFDRMWDAISKNAGAFFDWLAGGMQGELKFTRLQIDMEELRKAARQELDKVEAPRIALHREVTEREKQLALALADFKEFERGWVDQRLIDLKNLMRPELSEEGGPIWLFGGPGDPVQKAKEVAQALQVATQPLELKLSEALFKGSVEAVSEINKWRTGIRDAAQLRDEERILLERRQAKAMEGAEDVLRRIEEGLLGGAAVFGF